MWETEERISYCQTQCRSSSHLASRSTPALQTHKRISYYMVNIIVIICTWSTFYDTCILENMVTCDLQVLDVLWFLTRALRCHHSFWEVSTLSFNDWSNPASKNVTNIREVTQKLVQIALMVLYKAFPLYGVHHCKVYCDWVMLQQGKSDKGNIPKSSNEELRAFHTPLALVVFYHCTKFQHIPLWSIWVTTNIQVFAWRRQW